MPRPEQPEQGRRVKGSVLVDYLKIIRANPSLAWDKYLLPEDLEQLGRMILPASWYPLDLFQRMGVAIFKLVSGENYDVVHAFGRSLADRVQGENPGLVIEGEPAATVTKYLAIQDRLYSFQMFVAEQEGPGRLIVHVLTEPEEHGRRLLAQSTAGTLERLVELAGGREVGVNLVEKEWQGSARNSIEITWRA